MYRILTIKNFYNHNQKLPLLLTKQINFKSDRTTTIFTTKSSSESYPKRDINNSYQLLTNTRIGFEGNRYQSSTTTPTNSNFENIDLKSKKKIRKNIKYVELLEVTNLKTKETKTKVKKLKAQKLSDFILKSHFSTLGKAIKNREKNEKRKSKLDKAKLKENAINSSNDFGQPIEYQKVDIDMIDCANINAEDLAYDDRPLIFVGKQSCKVIESPNNIDKILRSLQNFKEISETYEHDDHEIGEFRNGGKVLDEKILEDIVIDPIEEDLSIQNAKNIKQKNNKELRYKSKYHKNLEQEKLAKYKSLITNLNSYLNVCVSSGNLNRGLSSLISYKQKSLKYSEGKFDFQLPIQLYNILLHGYAEKCAIDKIQMIYKILKEDNIPLNYQSYAAIFECLGREEESEKNINLLNKFKNEANLNGITLNDIMDKSKFQFDQCDIVLDAIRRVEPDFEPNFTPPKLYYTNPLLLKLNENIDEIGCEKNEIKDVLTMNSKRGFIKSQLQDFAKEQLKIELQGSITIKSIEKSVPSENREVFRQKFNELEKFWKIQIVNAINRDLNTLRAQIRFKPHGVMTYYTYLKALDSNHYADIVLKEIRSIAEGSETFSPTVGQLYRALGRRVQAKFEIEQKKKNGVLEKMGDIYSDYCSEWEDCKTNDNSRQIWQKLVHKSKISGPSMNVNDVAWPSNVLNGIGRFLYNILMRDIKVDANIMRNNKSKNQHLLPAFYTLYRNQGRIVKQEVKPHPVLARLLRASQQQTLTFESNLVPMLCPPQPWSTPINGGYLLTKSELIRLPQQAVQQWDRINSSNPQELYPALDSLNQLASIPWRVNTSILDIILEVFNNGGDSKLDVPQSPSSLPPLPIVPLKDPSISNEQRAKIFKQKMQYRRKQAEMYSLWCDTLYRLSLADHFRNKTFWLPHNMDFRGRVYPIPPHLNHLGSDLARSMLIFEQSQPLGIDGFNWLKLHCINLTGLKKRDSIRERLLYAENVMDDILDSADNPLTGRRWWVKSDEPWQTLACCFEIAAVSRSPDPAAYMSRFPIHQDGSCNGLQHYAALGRDQAGAISVNLSPSAVPQDVYSAVANLVEKSRKTDAEENGLHVAQVLNGYVRRKVIKQTVMTTVYGVTRYGARLQIARQLKDIDEFPKEWVWPASTYLTTKTFESLREMFTSTKEIQDWFTDCARLISTICSENVEWITPLGLPVVQPYNRQEIKSSKNNNSIRVTDVISMDMYEKPNVMKQKNAFPPNFIHSLDSSHMMLTSLFSERKGITFISVHDCFWTHASTVPQMNEICREQFVALHNQSILEDLSEFLINKYSFKEENLTFDGSVYDLTKRKLNRTLKQLPKKGDFKLENILKSVYFFS